jgi:prolyl-tRNA synthetase
MRLSQYFLPTLKENPAEAKVISHQLMLRAGMIYQTASGIYSWLPMGLRVLRKIEQIVREEQDAAGAQELLMPTIQPMELWEESGRGNAMGKEKLVIEDRHERKYVYAPTAEEVITDVFRAHVVSYRDLPKMLYQIQWKFRDEIRPRFGVMRGREFYMKDCYSFDLTPEAAKESYRKMFQAYMTTFKRMGLKAIPVQADTGDIGGDLSHEFQIIAHTGESEIFYDERLDSTTEIDDILKLYAASDEMHDPDKCPIPAEQLKKARGIEVGHVFYLGQKYSEPMKAQVTDPDGRNVTVHMGCYGIGVSRLIAAVIEASHDNAGIIWPSSVAPFDVGLINLRTGDSDCDAECEKIYQQLQAEGLEVLFDDRTDRAGAKFANMDLIGIPTQIIIGPNGLKEGKVEIKDRASGERKDVPFDQVVNYLKEKQNSYV